MDFSPLLDDIRAAYSGDGDLSAALTDLNFVEAGGDPVFPYGTYHYITGDGMLTAGNALLARRLIQFNLFDKGGDISDLSDAYGKLYTLYNQFNVISGSRVYQFTWENDWSFKENNIWQISSRFRVIDHPA